MDFPDLSSLAHHLLIEATNDFDHCVRKALKDAERVLVKEAKSEFGVYQDEVGPFKAWPELAQATKEDRVAKGFTENDPLLRSGKLRDEIVSERDHESVTVGSEDPVMAYQELGTGKIPPRPVLGTALFKHIDGLVDHFGKLGYLGLGGATALPDYTGSRKA